MGLACAYSLRLVSSLAPPEPMNLPLAYNIQETYEWNYARGPQFASAPPPRTDGPLKEFLGLPVRSKIGIAAGLLLNSKWVEGYAQRDFDILTYKTVRSAPRPCYPPPNWVFVEDNSGGADEPVYVTETIPANPAEISSAVCFGMPSMAPEIWREDVRRTKSLIQPGQILIVSVVATPSDQPTAAAIGEDFARCARWAVEAGADVIEANFSCPNVCSAEGTIYLDVALSKQIAAAVRQAIGSRPLLLKIGHFQDAAKFRSFLRAMHGLANGVTLVNGMSRPVLRRDGRPAFGPRFVKAGVLGRAIHEPSVESVRQAARIVNDERLDLTIAAVGGVSTVESAKEFFDAGGDAVLLGSSPMYLPEIAAEMKRAHPEW